VAHRRPDARNFIAGDARADPRAAHHNAPIRLPRKHGPANLLRDVREIDRMLVAAPVIDDRDVQRRKNANDLRLQRKPVMIAPEYNMKFSETSDNGYVTFDDAEGGYAAAKYLLELGHRDIKLVVGDVKGKVLSFNLKRIEGFKKSLEEFGVPFAPDMVLKVRGNMESSYHFIADLFTKERPTALLLSNELSVRA